MDLPPTVVSQSSKSLLTALVGLLGAVGARTRVAPTAPAELSPPSSHVPALDWRDGSEKEVGREGFHPGCLDARRGVWGSWFGSPEPSEIRLLSGKRAWVHSSFLVRAESPRRARGLQGLAAAAFFLAYLSR